MKPADEKIVAIFGKFFPGHFAGLPGKGQSQRVIGLISMDLGLFALEARRQFAQATENADPSTAELVAGNLAAFFHARRRQGPILEDEVGENLDVALVLGSGIDLHVSRLTKQVDGRLWTIWQVSACTLPKHLPEAFTDRALELLTVATVSAPLPIKEVARVSRRAQSALRAALLAKDPTCSVCGDSRREVLEVHHHLPLNRGGLQTLSNAKMLCSNCHRMRYP